MQNGNLTLVRGDDQVVGITVTTPSGTLYNLSGCTHVFQAMQNENYFSNPWLTETTGPSGHLVSVSGLSQLVFAAADTSGLDDLNHYYSIKLYSALGTTTTLLYGTFNLIPS
jgi:hypothetical protein